jgi:hypothetical protein
MTATKKNGVKARRVSGAWYTTYSIVTTAARNCHPVRIGKAQVDAGAKDEEERDDEREDEERRTNQRCLVDLGLRVEHHQHADEHGRKHAGERKAAHPDALPAAGACGLRFCKGSAGHAGSILRNVAENHGHPR